MFTLVASSLVKELSYPFPSHKRIGSIIKKMKTTVMHRFSDKCIGVNNPAQENPRIKNRGNGVYRLCSVRSRFKILMERMNRC